MKTKKIVALFSALTMIMSLFTGLAVPVHAATDLADVAEVKIYEFNHVTGDPEITEIKQDDSIEARVTAINGAAIPAENTFTYKWEQSTDNGSSWEDAYGYSGNTNQYFWIPGDAAEGTIYKVIVGTTDSDFEGTIEKRTPALPAPPDPSKVYDVIADITGDTAGLTSIFLNSSAGEDYDDYIYFYDIPGGTYSYDDISVNVKDGYEYTITYDERFGGDYIILSDDYSYEDDYGYYVVWPSFTIDIHKKQYTVISNFYGDADGLESVELVSGDTTITGDAPASGFIWWRSKVPMGDYTVKVNVKEGYEYTIKYEDRFSNGTIRVNNSTNDAANDWVWRTCTINVHKAGTYSLIANFAGVSDGLESVELVSTTDGTTIAGGAVEGSYIWWRGNVPEGEYTVKATVKDGYEAEVTYADAFQSDEKIIVNKDTATYLTSDGTPYVWPSFDVNVYKEGLGVICNVSGATAGVNSVELVSEDGTTITGGDISSGFIWWNNNVPEGEYTVKVNVKDGYKADVTYAEAFQKDEKIIVNKTTATYITSGGSRYVWPSFYVNVYVSGDLAEIAEVKLYQVYSDNELEKLHPGNRFEVKVKMKDGETISDSSLTYTYEQSTDGGVSWQNAVGEIANKTVFNVPENAAQGTVYKVTVTAVGSDTLTGTISTQSPAVKELRYYDVIGNIEGPIEALETQWGFEYGEMMVDVDLKSPGLSTGGIIYESSPDKIWFFDIEEGEYNLEVNVNEGYDYKVTYPKGGDVVVVDDADAIFSGYYYEIYDAFTLTLLRKEETPNIAIDYVNEKLTGFEASTFYTINGSNVTPVDRELDIADYIGTTIEIVRKKGRSNYAADSDPQSLVIPARPDAPSNLGATAPTTYGGKGTITGVDDTMEYSLKDANEWTAISGTSVEVAPGEYEVRVKAVAGESFASAAAAVKVDDYEPVKESTPTIAIDYENEKLTGFIDGASYTIDGSDVTPADGELDIADSYFGTELSIVKKGNGTATVDSDPQSLTVSARPDAPTGITATAPTIPDGNGTITGVTADMEYRVKGTDTWTAISGTSVEVAPGEYEVRVKAVAGTSFAGAVAEIKVDEYVPKPEETPTTAPTDAPTTAPTEAPTTAPTEAPTTAPTDAPTTAPTEAPTTAPTEAPTTAPTEAPTPEPGETPTPEPGETPTPGETIEPIGRFVDKVTIEKVTDEEGNISLVITPKSSDEELSDIMLFGAVYNVQGVLERVILVECKAQDGTIIVPVTEPILGTGETSYKLMLWTDSQEPIINAITNETGFFK